MPIRVTVWGENVHEQKNEFVAQNCYQLNQAFYASLGEKKAFVLSQGRNIMILKIVGYAEEAAAENCVAPNSGSRPLLASAPSAVRRCVLSFVGLASAVEGR